MAEENRNKEPEQALPAGWEASNEEKDLESMPEIYDEAEQTELPKGEPANDDWSLTEPEGAAAPADDTEASETAQEIIEQKVEPAAEATTAQVQKAVETVEKESKEAFGDLVDDEDDRDFWDRAPWMGGLILILLGAIFLLRNINVVSINNWWAIFILIPAFGSLANAWRTYKSAGRFTSAVSSALVGGLMMLIVALVFLLNLDWAYVWPVFLIVIGLGALLGGIARKK